MTKNVWVLCSFVCGIVLCVFGNAAFAVLGVFVGIGGIIGGIYFLCFMRYRGPAAIAIGAGLIVLGIVLIVLCIFLEPFVYFLGGIILAAAGVMLLIVCGRGERLLSALAAYCVLTGVLILFMPAFIGWLTVVIGVGLVIYSGVLLVYLY